MNALLIIVAYCLLVGIALLFCRLFHMNIAEGLVFSVLLLIILSTISFVIHLKYQLTIIVIFQLAFVGLFLAVHEQIFNKDYYKTPCLSYLISPCFIALCIILLLSMAIYAGSIVLNMEELNTWIIAEKYMYEHSKIPPDSGQGFFLCSAFFQYFFVKISGFSEATLYLANALMYWIGLLLPFGNLRKDRWPRLLLYILIIHIGLYSMYLSGSKTCTSEIVIASWVGGIAGWLLNKGKKKELDRGRRVSRHKKKLDRKKGINLVAVFVIALVGLQIVLRIIFPDYLMAATVFFEYLIEKSMSLGRSDLNYTFVFGLVLVITLLCLAGEQTHWEKEHTTFFCICFCFSGAYLSALFYMVLQSENYWNTLYMEGIQRKVAILVIGAFVMSLSWLLTGEEHDDFPMIYAPGIVLLLVFIYGINSNYITDTTAAYPEKSVYYSDVQKVKKEVYFLNRIISSKKRIFMINQAGREIPGRQGFFREEIACAEAVYLLEDRVSDYRNTPWRFTRYGGYVMNKEDPYQTLRKLPGILKRGRYDYIWIYNTDSFFNKYYSQIIIGDIEKDYSEELYDGQLYKIVYNDGKISKFKLVGFITGYDNRDEYIKWNNME